MSMTSLFRRNQAQNTSPIDHEGDEENDQIDPELRLRTVRTASSAIAESIRSELRRERQRAKRRRLWGSLKSKKPPSNAGHDTELRQDSTSGAASSGKPRRNVYVNSPLSSQDKDSYGRPLRVYVRNKVRTSSQCLLANSWLCEYFPLTHPKQNILFLHLYQRISTSSLGV